MLRALAQQSSSFEQTAQSITRFLYESFVDPTTHNRSCLLVRFFKTDPYSRLPEDLRAFTASQMPSAAPAANTMCLTLLASIGDEPSWNSRHSSNGHKCIPLGDEAIAEQSPMFGRLIEQFGLTVGELSRPARAAIASLERRSLGVFHIPVAADSPCVPAQNDFVEKYRIASVLGFGAMLPHGSLVAVVMFTRTHIPASTAAMFRTIALSMKLGLLDLMGKPIFAGESGEASHGKRQ